ncbi:MULTISPECIES: ImmA/IrrE family metallo-endopeptidase [unclassified Pseudomonas]|uniref:helix-turn-helix domain-containing protein n=1 Tax=unclassified Pseudomonas TaxID=196821 RepID=UPI001F5726ED|nr:MULTISPECIES: ImmA/IrrE family metallo-endopeptidase [unclassified Pseudomonas]
MNVDLTLISERLKNSRENLEYSLSEVSNACGIAGERLTELELGSSAPTGDEILILASLYKCDFLQLLDEKRPAPSSLTEILFRRFGNTFNKQDRRSVQEFLYFCQCENELETILERKKTKPDFIWTGDFFKKHGADAASWLRKYLGIPSNSVQRDIYSDFREIGIHIFRRKLSNSEISGLYIQDPIAGHCILINYNEDIYRQRFSVAHEVAHSIFDSKEKIRVTYDIGSTKYSKKDLIEIRANSFASNYLMPPAMLRSISHWDQNTIVHWAQQFRVSTSALSKALKDEGIITPQQADALKIARVANSEKVDPEAPQNLTKLQRERRTNLLEKGLSDYYVSLCCEAHENNLISTHRLCELLGVEHQDLSEIGKLFGWTIKHGF